jgi:mono/diheme cytochrome c family protein
MMPGLMPRSRPVLAVLGGLLALAAGGCGLEIPFAENTPEYRAATVFNTRCSGCHTFDAAASKGSAPPRFVGGGERTNGPNFNQRVEDREAVLYAIRNGGFSGAIMPANIVVGEDAEVLADFVAKYAGRERGG